MKRKVLFMTLAMAVVLTACGGKADKEASSNTEANVSEDAGAADDGAAEDGAADDDTQTADETQRRMKRALVRQKPRRRQRAAGMIPQLRPVNM